MVVASRTSVPFLTLSQHHFRKDWLGNLDYTGGKFTMKFLGGCSLQANAAYAFKDLRSDGTDSMDRLTLVNNRIPWESEPPLFPDLGNRYSSDDVSAKEAPYRLPTCLGRSGHFAEYADDKYRQGPILGDYCEQPSNAVIYQKGQIMYSRAKRNILTKPYSGV